MSNYRRAREGNTYFLTVVTYKRQAILCGEVERTALREGIEECKGRYPFIIKAIVLLPEHLHCLWELPDGDKDYSMRWGWIKKEFSKKIKKQGTMNDLVGTTGTAPSTLSRIKHREMNIWQRRFWEHLVRDDEDYRLHCDYIHYNPVKHGLVKMPKDWLYSTFRKFVSEGIYDESWACDVESIRKIKGK